MQKVRTINRMIRSGIDRYLKNPEGRKLRLKERVLVLTENRPKIISIMNGEDGGRRGKGHGV